MPTKNRMTALSALRPFSGADPACEATPVKVTRLPTTPRPVPLTDQPPCPAGCDESAATIRSKMRSEEHTSELQSLAYLVCRLLLEKKKKQNKKTNVILHYYN